MKKTRNYNYKGKPRVNGQILATDYNIIFIIEKALNFAMQQFLKYQEAKYISEVLTPHQGY